MKNNIYKYVGLACLAVLSSCADDQFVEYQTQKPISVAQYEYLNQYDALKAYLTNPNANPNLKLGIGVGANDFINGGIVRALAVSNFHEMTAGNEMKYASCVRDDGSMDFTTVTKFVEAAKSAGMTIYGHTLAWHSQQNNKYLNGIIADKKIEVSDEPREVEIKHEDYTTYTGFPYFVMGYTPEFDEEGLVSKYPGSWYQYFVADGISTIVGDSYKVTAYVKGSTAGSMNVQFGNWGALTDNKLDFTEEWSEVSFTVASPSESCFIVFQPGDYEGEIHLKWLTVAHLETGGVTKVPEYVYQNDFSDPAVFPGGWGNNSTFTVVEGVGPDGSAALKITNPSPVGYWEAQMAVDFPEPFTNGTMYHAEFKIKGPAGALFRTGFQNPDYSSAGDFPNVTLTGEWQDVSLAVACNSDISVRWIFSFGDIPGEIYLDDMALYYEKEVGGIPLTPEEKKDTLLWAMDNWIGGMMQACGGYVTAWDVVNEALSGKDKDGDGIYDLQSATRETVSAADAKANFYWQDYLGDEDYVRTAVRLAREHFAANGGNAADLKLFINDYNLESDWDGNMKLKSLIEWIKRWEADGVTKIDGIGTQMHVTYYVDQNIQQSKQNAIEQMFKLMAATGKLVKISELDMGICDPNAPAEHKVSGSDNLKSEFITYEQHLAMADFYKFIIEKYFELIPKEQQYGITQWAATDSPADSGWRGGEPIGLWDLNYNRKPAYGGFANGLAGNVIVTPSDKIIEVE